MDSTFLERYSFEYPITWNTLTEGCGRRQYLLHQQEANIIRGYIPAVVEYADPCHRSYCTEALWSAHIFNELEGYTQMTTKAITAWQNIYDTFTDTTRVISQSYWTVTTTRKY